MGATTATWAKLFERMQQLRAVERERERRSREAGAMPADLALAALIELAEVRGRVDELRRALGLAEHRPLPDRGPPSGVGVLPVTELDEIAAWGDDEEEARP